MHEVCISTLKSIKHSRENTSDLSILLSHGHVESVDDVHLFGSCCRGHAPRLWCRAAHTNLHHRLGLHGGNGKEPHEASARDGVVHLLIGSRGSGGHNGGVGVGGSAGGLRTCIHGGSGAICRGYGGAAVGAHREVVARTVVANQPVITSPEMAPKTV